MRPATFFQEPRITLEDTRRYENSLKARLHDLSQSKPQVIEGTLESFAVDSPQQDTPPILTPRDVLQVARAMKRAGDMSPAVFFELNTCRCLELFMGVVRELEREELEHHPDHYRNLEAKEERRRDMTRAIERAIESQAAAQNRRREDPDDAHDREAYALDAAMQQVGDISYDSLLLWYTVPLGYTVQELAVIYSISSGTLLMISICVIMLDFVIG